jgi:hypothetical protein
MPHIPHLQYGFVQASQSLNHVLAADGSNRPPPASGDINSNRAFETNLLHRWFLIELSSSQAGLHLR